MDKGQWAQKETEKWLIEKSNANLRFAWHRYPDARAARGGMSMPQPADYLVGWRGIATNLEVKETAQKTRLPKAKIGQYGKLKLWNFAGFETALLIYRSFYNDWVVLEASDLFPPGDAPASFQIADPLRKTYDTAAQALERMFA